MKIFTPLIAVFLFCASCAKSETTSVENTIYDSNTNHLWNRLNQTLFVRSAPDGKKFGLDELDILFWFRTTNLVTEPSHHQAIAILDEFINKHGEKMVHTPIKRALLQRDLWELFDWSTKNRWKSEETRARNELQSRLAVLIRRLALTTNEIAALPNNYLETKTNDAPDLPHGLTETNSEWLSVSDQNDSLTAPAHVSSFDGRSTFQVLVHFTNGRQAANAYLDKLRQFEHVWIYVTNNSPFATTNEPREMLSLNPALPQFPTNTEWALVRRMCVIDVDGKIQPTQVTESIQMLRYYTFTAQLITNSGGGVNLIIPQKCYEFQMDRRQNYALRQLGQEEKGFNFVHFRGMGIDQFEYTFKNSDDKQPPPDSSRLKSMTLRTCMQCHSGPGIFSVNSYTKFLSFSESWQRPAKLTPLDPGREIDNAIYWKQRQFSWGLLQGLWNREN